MSTQSPRLAARAVLIVDNRLLLVNAYPDHDSDLWCAPGGGVERGASLTDNLIREVYEETGLTVSVGAPASGQISLHASGGRARTTASSRPTRSMPSGKYRDVTR